MTNTDNQDQARREEMIAGGPVSAGASNIRAPVNGEQSVPSNTENTSLTQGGTADYNKLIQSNASGTTLGSGMATGQGPGTPGGGALPTESADDSTRGGMNTSSSTVSAGSSSAGRVLGEGANPDRGSMSDTSMNATTNTHDEITHKSDAS